MKIRLIAVGKRVPAWIQEGFADYAQRIPREFNFELIEIEPGRRTKAAQPDPAIAEEGSRMLAAIDRQTHVVAFDERGRTLTTRDFSQRLDGWLREAVNIDFLIGGPDGLAPEIKLRANETWSLSAMTMPHALARVVAVEQIYRAWCIVCHHPYHRE